DYYCMIWHTNLFVLF
nr:immunoglobulin light chain junction region [Macaca mulatta]